MRRDNSDLRSLLSVGALHRSVEGQAAEGGFPTGCSWLTASQVESSGMAVFPAALGAHAHGSTPSPGAPGCAQPGRQGRGSPRSQDSCIARFLLSLDSATGCSTFVTT